MMIMSIDTTVTTAKTSGNESYASPRLQTIKADQPTCTNAS